MGKRKAGPGRPLGSTDSGEVSNARLRSQSRNGSQTKGYYHDEATKKMLGDARKRGAHALPEVIEDVVRMAVTGYSRYIRPDGAEEYVRLEPETRLYAARFLGDRCGLPPKAETEISAAEGLPLTLIVMGSEETQSQ
mgnify:CR=1 FL=1